MWDFHNVELNQKIQPKTKKKSLCLLMLRDKGVNNLCGTTLVLTFVSALILRFIGRNTAQPTDGSVCSSEVIQKNLLHTALHQNGSSLNAV